MYKIYQVFHKILPSFLVPDKTSNNASRSTKIVTRSDCSILTKFWNFYVSVISTLASIHTDVNSCRNCKYHKMQVLKFTSLAVSEPVPSHLWQIFSESVNGSPKDEHLTTISVNINTISCFVPQQSLFDWWVWIQKLWRERSNAFWSESLHFYSHWDLWYNRPYT